MRAALALRRALCERLSWLPEGPERDSIPQRIARLDDLLGGM